MTEAELKAELAVVDAQLKSTTARLRLHPSRILMLRHGKLIARKGELSKQLKEKQFDK